jgi:hypothetical protein
MPKSLPVICGDTTCYSFTEKLMCRFSGALVFGTRPVCLLYRDKHGDYQLLKENEFDCLERLPECLAEIK